MHDYANLDEINLLDRLASGDEGAFTEIYNRYWEKLLAIGFYFLRDKQSAEDIVHEVFISLWQRKHEVQIQSLQAYLATAVKFAVFKSIARSRRQRELLANNVNTEFSVEIEHKLDLRFLEEYLQNHFEQMPGKAKIIFQYRENELTIAAIAEKMKLSPKSVEYHITKTLRSLRESLKKIKSLFA